MASSSLAARFGALASIIAAVAALFAASALLSLLTPALPSVLRMPVLALGLWGGVGAGALLLLLGKTSFRAIGFTRPRSWRRTWLCAIGAIIVAETSASALGALISATTNWPMLDAGYIRTAVEGNPLAYAIWIVLVVWGSAAFGEELFARGFLMDRARVIFGGGRIAAVFAAIAQALIFGALHAIQGPTGIVLTAATGLVLAGAYYASGRNLWAPIIAHGLIDTLALTLFLLHTPLPGFMR